jgi:hypothetical protein
MCSRERTVRHMLSAIITLICDDGTLGGVRQFLAECAKYGVDLDTELLDGGHARVEDGTSYTAGKTVRSLSEFSEQYADAASDTPVRWGAELAVDFAVIRVTPISCGSHIGEMPTNILVEVHPACTTCA